MPDPSLDSLSSTGTERGFETRARIFARAVRTRFMDLGARVAKLSLKLAPLVVLIVAARFMLGDEYQVPTASMWPTIEPGDRIFVARAAYGFRLPFFDRVLIEASAPAVGDVVVFGDPRGGETPLVKRVVARAGQTVRLEGGVLFVDGLAQRLERLADGRVLEHLGASVHESGMRDFENFGPAVVPLRHVFVMGDNRAVSLDSRALGPIPLALLRGRVLGTALGAGESPERIVRAFK